MALTPQRGGERRPGLLSSGSATAFRSEADLALARFRESREGLARQVRRGELTTKVARRQAEEFVLELRRELMDRAGQTVASRPLHVRLGEASAIRRMTSQTQTPEALQRETNRLLRQTLLEQQLVNRAMEFEGRTFIRPLAGGAPAPTLESLLRFQEESERCADEAACEWARRQLEALRPRITSEDDLRRVDSACDRPDQVNPRIVARYVEALSNASADDMEQFVGESLRTSDASACCAAFILAQECKAGEAARWVRNLLDGLGSLPDAALNTLRSWDAEAARQESDACRAEAEFVISLAEAEVRSLEASAPTADDLRREAAIERLEPPAMDQPIGLKLSRRGLTPQEFEANVPVVDDSTDR